MNSTGRAGGQGRGGLKSGVVWMNSTECELDEREGREEGG